MHGTYLRYIQSQNVKEYKKCLRMAPHNFDELLRLIEANTTKNDTNIRDSIPANVKLAATIWYSDKVIPIYKINSGTMRPQSQSSFQKTVAPIT